MSPEVQAAFNQLVIIFLGVLGIALTALGAVITQWRDERKKRRQAQKDLAQEKTQNEVEREGLLNDFTEDCLKRVGQLDLEMRTMRQQMDAQEQTHEADRARWIEERNALNQRIERMEGDRDERELVIKEQSEVIAVLQNKVERQGKRIDELERRNHELNAQMNGGGDDAT